MPSEPTQDVAFPTGSPPEAAAPRGGIFFGWYIVAAAVALNVLTAGVVFYGFPVLIVAILEDYDWTKAAAMGGFAIAQLSGTLAPIWGSIVDRFGARVPMMIGTVGLAVGYLILSRLDSLLMLYVGFAAGSLMWSVYWTAPLAVLGNWFKERRTIAMGVATCGFGLSAVMLPLLNWALGSYHWRTVLVGAAVGTLVLCLPLCLLLRQRPEPYGLSVDGAPASAGGENDESAESESAESSFSGKEALATSAFWMLVLVFTLTWMAFTGIVPNMLIYLTSVGIDADLATISITLLISATIVGRIGSGVLGDRFDKRRVLMGGFLLLAVCVLLFAIVSKPWQLVPVVFLTGAAAGALIPLMPSIVSDYFGMRGFALIFGLLHVPATLIWFVVPSAVGWVFDTYGTYQPAWFALAAITLIGVPVLLLLRPPASSEPEPAQTWSGSAQPQSG